MATQNQVNIGINVSDNGTAKKTVKNFEEITKAANTAQRAASNINTPVGGTAGSRAAYSKAAPSGSQAMLSGEEYNRGRGSMGATGASARDFANQAQGLGGLVRLYATYAANIFAVSAAFNALSNAMDTANMVRGLDQLGAASGVALGSLSKDLVKATDGAISLRDAMTATAKASSSGMSSEQILRMGKVAQQASQTLGVDMADAISRISRGITKLEPELLDELGLFTKTGKAAEDYAKSVGKSVTELTDFERRAAFANAVLAEGEAKFSQIKLDVNPYTKLLASIKDLAQTSLEFINKGLAPIVSYLSNSPTALGVAIAALGTVLVKQALPALGEFKAGLASVADRANQLSLQKAQDASKARLAIDADILNRVESMADDKVAAVDAAERKIQAIESSGLNKRSAAYKLLQKDITEVTQADIDAVEKRAKIAEKGGDTKTAAAYREVTSAVLEQKKAEEDLVNTKQILSKQLEKDAAGMTTYGMTVRAAEKAQTAATRANIVSNAAYNGSLIGVTASMTLMRAEMQAAGIATNTFAGRLLLARGALAAVGGAVSTLMAALGPIMLLITAVSLAFSLFDGALSKNSKQSAELSGSLDKLDSSADHLTKTIDTINQKPFLERMSPESLKVKATALGEVSSAISSTVNDLLKADKAASGWDKFIDGFKTIWNGDMLSKTSKSLATGITSSLANIAGSPEAKALNKDLSNILKIDTETATFQQVQDAIKKIGKESPKDLRLVEDGFKKIALASQVSAAKGTELVESFKKLSDIKQTLGNKFLPTDDLTKFGQELAATSQKLSIALQDPQQKLNAIIQLGANAINIPGATFEQVSALNKAADAAKNIQIIEAKQLENKQQLIDKQEELSKLVGKERAASIAAGKQTLVSGLNQEGLKQVDKLKADLRQIQSASNINVKVKTELTSKLEGYSKEIEAANLATYKAGADLVAKQISAEFIKAGKVVSDAYVSIIGETEATIKIKANSERALVNAQLQQILSQRDLTIATRELSLQLQKQSLEDYLKNNTEGRNNVQLKLAALEPQIQAVEAAKTGDFSKLKLSTDSKDLKNLNVEANNFVQNMQASAAAANNLQAQLKAITIGEKDKALQASFGEPKKKLENEEKSVALTKQGLDIQGKLVTQGNLAFLSAKQTLELTQLDLQQRIALLANEVEIARQKQISIAPDATEDIKAAALGKKAQLEAERKTLESQQQQQKTNLKNSQVQEKLGALAFNAEELRKREAENAELVLNKKSEELKIQESLFGMYSSIGLLSETQKINQKFLIEQKSAELDYEQKISKLKTSSGQQMGQLDAREEAIWTQIGTGTGNQAALIAELDEIAKTKALITKRTDEEAAAAAKVRDNTIGIANAIKTAGLEQERYNQLLENSSALAESLSAAFGDVGSKLGSLAESLTKIAISTEQGSKALEKIGKDAESAWSAGEIDKAIELESEYEKQKKKNNKTELDGNLKAISGTKSLFKEKTFAYKALDKIERAMHIYKMAVFLKETAMDIWATGVSVANSATRTGASIVEAGVDGVKAVVKAISAFPPPFSYIAGAATAAVVGGLLSQIGGRSPGAVSGGAIENDGTGTVLGDKSAKSTAIQGTIEVLQDADPVLMRNSTNMLKHLRSIDDNIAAFGSALARSVGADDIAERMEIQQGTRVTGRDATLAFGLPLNKLPVIGGVFAGLAKALGFGTSTSVKGQGLELGGQSLGQIGSGSGINAGFYADVETRNKAFGITYDKNTTTQRLPFSAQDRDLQLALDRTFEGVYSSALAASETFGIAQADMMSRLSNYQIQQQRIKLSGSLEDQQQQLLAGVGKITDQIFLQLLPQATSFQKLGETYVTTVGRVVYGTEQAKILLDNLGITAVQFTNIVNKQGDIGAEIVRQSIVVQETGNNFIREVITSMSGTAEEIAELYTSLSIMRDRVLDFGGSAQFVSEAAARAAGGTDKLGDAIANFYEKFTSDAQKTADNNRKVGELFGTLNLAIPKTREEVLTLVNALTASDPAAAAKIMVATDKLNEFYDTIETRANKEAEERKALEQKLFELTATKEQLRERELEGLFEENRALQRRIWLVEEQSEILKTTATSFRDFSKQVKDFKSSLLLGASSTLTPSEKYTEAKTQFDTIYSQALAGDKVAMGKVTNSAQTFLEASKTYFASSTAYTNDFNTVLGKLDNASISAEASASVAELQLTALGVQTTLLTSINANIATIAGVPQAAGGGRVKGLTLVGELGPELVDFTNPGQVYTAEQTAGMFAPKAGVSNNMNQVVQELRQVRQEIAQLRKDQQQQTGDLIVSNYDANKRAADVITTEVANTATLKEWQQRNKVAVV